MNAETFTVGPKITFLVREGDLWKCAVCPLTYPEISDRSNENTPDWWSGGDPRVIAARDHFIREHGTEGDAERMGLTYYRPKRVLGSNETDFAQQFLGEFATLEMPLEERLALYYHVRCEHFDRVVCPVRDVFGDARPVTTHETALINQHATEVLHQLAAAHPELPIGRLQHAIRRYGQRYTTEAMEWMLERLNERKSA